MTSSSTSQTNRRAAREVRAPAQRARRTRQMTNLDRPECLRLLASNGFGRLAVNLGDEAPLLRPVNYVFDDSSKSIVFRTAPGTKLHALRRAKVAAFEIDGIDASSRTGWSVIITGVTEEVTRPADVRRLAGLGLETWPPGEKSSWVRIRAWTVSGRRIELGSDHERRQST